MPQVILRVRERSTLQHRIDAFGSEPHAVLPADGTRVDHAQLRLGDGWVVIGTYRPDPAEDEG